MPHTARVHDRRTSVDVVFDYLYDSISSLELRPGDKISEAEIAAQFGVSRQPVRDAFSRLANLDLLLIRPQKATEVQRFSMPEITKSRFVRAAIEAEVLRRATRVCTDDDRQALDQSLTDQKAVVKTGSYDDFRELDYAFHRLLCQIGKVDFAFDVIAFEKAKVDRLCLLSLSKGDRLEGLLADHEEIARCVTSGDSEGAVTAGMAHLSRLDGTIEAILAQNPDYFVD